MSIKEGLVGLINRFRQKPLTNDGEYLVRQITDPKTGLIVEVPADVQEEAREDYAAAVAEAFTSGKTVVGNLPISEKSQGE